MRVFLYGAGKVGRGLARAAREAGLPVELHPARRGLPRRVRASLLILTVRDGDLRPLAQALADAGAVGATTAVVHTAGALDTAPLAPLRGRCAGIAQMHPMMSFASPAQTPHLRGGGVHVQGDAAAARLARAFARRLGMVPRSFPGLDTVGYHAAAGLVANGAAALAATGAELLLRCGVPRDVAPKLLGPLLRSVAENVEALAFPAALTGPIRRGDAGAVERHLAVLRARLPEAVPLYLASAAAQLPLARALGEGTPEAFVQLAAWLAREGVPVDGAGA